jgi:hypothetical protein
MMPTMFVLPWRWTGQPCPEDPLLFASRFDGTGPRSAWRLLTGGIRLRRAVLRAPGAVGVSLRAHPFRGHYYTVSLWQDQQSLRAFAHGPTHQRAVRGLAELGPPRGVLVSRPAGPQRPTWPDTVRWLITLEPGPYRHQPAVARLDLVEQLRLFVLVLLFGERTAVA